MIVVHDLQLYHGGENKLHCIVIMKMSASSKNQFIASGSIRARIHDLPHSRQARQPSPDNIESTQNLIVVCPFVHFLSVSVGRLTTVDF